MLTANVPGNYDFIRTGGPFSSGCIARPGFAVVHAAIHPLTPLARGFELVDRHLRDNRRPIAALCGMQLRIPAALSPAGFEEFNRPYVERLTAWGLGTAGANPVARTNVALEFDPVAEPMLAGFFYTAPADGDASTFVLSGVPELTVDADGKRTIVARGDSSAGGIARKLACVTGLLTAHLATMRLSWADATAINLYTVHDVYPALASELLPAIGAGARAGLTWHYSRPPVSGLEMELDAWGVRHSIVLDGA
ncbi:MAG TPA: hypothetical protein VND20_00110 [Candidatus Binataceae bacterium]|nr:hypothetical protein [Candidatus Binataceae bacterium]